MEFGLSTKNYYSRVFNETTQDGFRRDQDNGLFREFLAVPEVTEVYQNKLEGEHALGSRGTKFNWSGSLTNIAQQVMDMRKIRYGKTITLLGVDYFDSPQANGYSDANGMYDYRLSTHLKERDYNWSTTLSHPFDFLKDKSVVKAGYAGWHKNRSLGSTRVNTIKLDQSADFPLKGRYEDIMAPDRIGASRDSAFYYADSRLNGTQFNGTAKYHSAFLMLDQRFFQKLRLVYGIRAENFNLANNQEVFRKSVEEGTSDMS